MRRPGDEARLLIETTNLHWKRLYNSLFTVSLLANDKIIALIIYSCRKLITKIIVQSLQLIKFNSMLVHFRFSISADYTKDLFGLQLANLEGRKELEPSCVPHLFLGSLLGTSPSKSPRSLFET